MGVLQHSKCHNKRVGDIKSKCFLYPFSYITADCCLNFRPVKVVKVYNIIICSHVYYCFFECGKLNFKTCGTNRFFSDLVFFPPAMLSHINIAENVKHLHVVD